MASIRVSTTWLDQFRHLRNAEPWFKEEELIGSIQGKPFEMNLKARCGCALGQILRFPEKGFKRTPDDTCVHYEGYFGKFSWDAKTVSEILSTIDRRGTFESKIEYHVMIDGHEVTLVGKADYLLGSDIEDYKCKFSQWSIEDYEEAVQQKVYLWAFQGTSFTYRMFDMKEPDEDGFVKIKKTSSFTLYPYGSLEHDCRAWLSDFLAWMELRGLIK